MGSNLRQRTCRTCGKTFWGGPRAWYCPICREERQRLQSAAFKARQSAGKTRPLGSIDTCCRCGAEYVVNGGNQRYCPACAPEAVRQADRAQGLDYYRANRESINPERNARRRKPDRVCAICGAEYTAYGKSKFCSAECRRVDARRRSARTEEKRKAKRREKRMEKTTNSNGQNSHGGKRPGAGRPYGGGRAKEARQVTLSPELWARIDDELAQEGVTRTAFFENLVEKFFKEKYFAGI